MNAIFDEYIKLYFTFDPIKASESGYDEFDTRWPDVSSANLDRYVAELTRLELKARQITPQDNNEKIDLDLLQRNITLEIFGIQSQAHHLINPCYYNGAVSNGLFTIMMNVSLDPKTKATLIGKRLEGVPDFLLQGHKNLKNPVKLWNKIAIEEIAGTVEYLRHSILPFLQQHSIPSCESSMKKAIEALFAFQIFLEEHKNLKSDFAIGRDNFEFLLKHYHGIDKSADEIRKIGFAQIDELNILLDRQAEKIDDNKSWEELIDLLKKNHPSSEGLLKAYQHKMAAIKNFLIEKNLVTLPPEETLKIIDTPGFLQSSIPFAAYCPPAMFSKNAQGLFFVSPVHSNEELLKDHCFASFPLTVLHEAYPGHHLQFACQRLLPSAIRKISNVSSNYEGWTLYCEEMMHRVGYYDDAMRLYQLKDRLWRAVRIVVDVSMHCFGMSDDEATKFLVDQARLSERGARVDVNWYTQSPTIPMSYLIGTLELDKIREEYMAKGKSLKDFHDAFLKCGAIPLHAVREILTNTP